LAKEGYYTTDTAKQEFMFNQFLREYGRSYDSTEYPKRLQIFVNNLKLIDERNLKEKGSAKHGITQFADMSQDEFKKTHLTATSNSEKQASADGFHKVLDKVEYTGRLNSVDWSGVYTTPVKDQGYCGSCWAFSATEQLESDAMRVLGTNDLLSVEQTNQCTQYAVGGGCRGGMTESAYRYMRTSGGLVRDSDYPYTQKTYEGVTGECEVDTSQDILAITGYTTLRGEENMANYMITTGPLSVCVAAEVWNTYREGVLETCPGSVDHCVQAVGVDTSKTNGYWKVRNSWGTRWGESGYIRLAYGENTCKITDDPTFVEPIRARSQ